MTKLLRVWALALTLLAFQAGSGSAQVRFPLGGPPNREQMVERIARQFQDRMARELDLQPEQREDLVEILQEYGAARAELLPRRRAVGAEMRILLQGNRSNDRALDLIRELRDIRDEERDLLQDEEDRLLEVLDPIQVLHLQLLRDQFGEQIRSLGAPPSPGVGPQPRRFFRFRIVPGF